MDKEIIDKGFYMIGQKKMVWDPSIYKKDLDQIANINLDHKNKHSLQFAIFRSNLYNLKLNRSIDEDFELYTKLYKINKIEEVHANTIFISDSIKVESGNEYLRKQFLNSFKEKQFFVVNSFHYASYKMILKYLISQDCDIYLFGTNKSILKNQEKTNFFVRLFNEKYATTSSVEFINAEQPDSLLKLSEVAIAQPYLKAKVLLVFVDGNMSSKGKTINYDKNNDKYYEKVLFHDAKIFVRKGVFAFAKMFKLPVFDVVMTEEHNKPILTINHLYDCNSKNTYENIVPSIFKSYQNLISRENIPFWECIISLHHWLEKKVPGNDYVNELNYEDDRFMIINSVGGETYIFDLKYYLSYKINEGLSVYKADVKQLVIQQKVRL